MNKKIKISLCMILCTTTFMALGCSKKDKISINNKDKLKNIQLPKEKENNLELDIFFDASVGQSDVEIAKEEVLIPKDEVIGELIVNSLIKGPSINGKLKPVLPKDARLLSFSIKDGIAFVNLSREVNIKMTSAKEEACLRSIVTSLTQLPSISKVKILIDNKDADTLGGNFNISKPFGKDDIASLKK